MRIVIHKGASEIGGTCIELSHDEGTVLLDIGLPLAEDSVPVDIASMNPDAVIVSHPHQDHFGLIESLDDDMPVYIGELSRRLMDASRVFIGKEPLRNDFSYFKAWEPFEVAGFNVTPYLVDHSAPDAYAFLIQDGANRVFYSGDFRGHGRKSVVFERITANPPPDIDVLFMEGTMLHRGNERFPNESAVEEEIRRTLRQQKNTSFLVSSSQNIDRVVSAYRACLSTGKTLVVDVYAAWVLEQLKLISDHVPNMAWPQVGVYIPGGQYQTVKQNQAFFGDFAQRIFEPEHRLTMEQLKACPERYLRMIRLSGARLIEKWLGEETTTVLYSLWDGYLDESRWSSFGAEKMASLQNDPRVHFVYAHTSGHAVLADLKAFTVALNPRMLVPIHTEHRGDYKEYFYNVVELEDGQELVL